MAIVEHDLVRLDELQEKFYADGRHRLLVVLQGMDTAGKGGAIRRVFEGMNPSGVRVAGTGATSVTELIARSPPGTASTPSAAPAWR